MSATRRRLVSTNQEATHANVTRDMKEMARNAQVDYFVILRNNHELLIFYYPS